LSASGAGAGCSKEAMAGLADSAAAGLEGSSATGRGGGSVAQAATNAPSAAMAVIKDRLRSTSMLLSS
jgi:hypothetical protein